MGKSSLYTRTGDAGETSLVGGERVRKDCLRLESYGTLDELSSALGIVAASDGVPESVKEDIKGIQNELFNLGCYLATAVLPGDEPKCSSGLIERIADLERGIDRLDEATPKIRAFILPGGCIASSYAHLARTICRRGERAILRLGETEYVDPEVVTYINRLSDWLFAVARHLNHCNGIEEITWRQG